MVSSFLGPPPRFAAQVIKTLISEASYVDHGPPPRFAAQVIKTIYPEAAANELGGPPPRFAAQVIKTSTKSTEALL